MFIVFVSLSVLLRYYDTVYRLFWQDGVFLIIILIDTSIDLDGSPGCQINIPYFADNDRSVKGEKKLVSEKSAPGEKVTRAAGFHFFDNSLDKA